MDANKLIEDDKNQLEMLRDLCHQFAEIVNDINELNNSFNALNGVEENSAAKKYCQTTDSEIDAVASGVNCLDSYVTYHNATSTRKKNTSVLDTPPINGPDCCLTGLGNFCNSTHQPELHVEFGELSVDSNVAHHNATSTRIEHTFVLDTPPINGSDCCLTGSGNYYNSTHQPELHVEFGELSVGSNVAHQNVIYPVENTSFISNPQNDIVTFGEYCQSGHNNRTCSNEKSSTSLVNYLYYLHDGSDSYDMLDHSLDLYTRNVGSFEIVEETRSENVPNSYTELVTPQTATTYYNIDSRTSNETAAPEIEQQYFSENEVRSDHKEVLTVDLMSNTSNLGGSSKENVDAWQLNLENPNRRYGCDNSKMHIPTSDEGTKKYCCIYCLKAFSKLVRHLMAAHKDEEDVISFVTQPVGSKQRQVLIEKIRIRGQLEWNKNEAINGGVLQTTRRTNKKFRKDAVKYTTCANCFKQLYTTSLRYHWNTCTNKSLAGERIVKKLSRTIEARVHVDACEELVNKVFPSLGENKAGLAVRFDWIVITYANTLCTNYDEHFQMDMVCTYIRSAGKILLASRAINSNVSDFASLYNVKNCNSVIEAIRTIAKYDTKLKTFKSPATASTLITLMNKIGKKLIVEYMRLDYKDKTKAVERFLTVFQDDAKFKINKLVAVAKIKAKREKDENIPSTDDVEKLSDYLDVEREAAVEKFKQLCTFTNEKEAYDAWLRLSELTMMSVLVFNRKRVGDTQNILVSDFRGRQILTACTNSLDIVPEETKEMIKSRMLVRGKLYRTVSVLLKHSFDDCLELLLHHRNDAKVPANNKFLFGLPSKSKKIRTIGAGALFRKYSKLCGAGNSSSLRGTNIRKHFATVCGTMGLSDNEVTNVAQFMGHSEKIHRDVYRHNSLGQEVVQMSNLLRAALGKSTSGSTVELVGQHKVKPKKK